MISNGPTWTLLTTAGTHDPEPGGLFSRCRWCKAAYWTAHSESAARTQLCESRYPVVRQLGWTTGTEGFTAIWTDDGAEVSRVEVRIPTLGLSSDGTFIRAALTSPGQVRAYVLGIAVGMSTTARTIAPRYLAELQARLEDDNTPPPDNVVRFPRV